MHRAVLGYSTESLDSDTLRIKQSLIPPHIDYICFLDSDDYWVEDCLLECVKVSDGVDVVWFDVSIIHNYHFKYEGYDEANNISQLEQYTRCGLPCDTIISARQWLEIAMAHRLFFAFVLEGLIDFSFLRRTGIMFVDYAQWEDVFFGIMLFSQTSRIYVLGKKLYCYCINPQSTSKYNKNIQQHDLPLSMQSLCEVFNNAYEAKEYYKFQSVIKAALILAEFLSSHSHESIARGVREYYLASIIGWSLGLLPAKDPWHVYEQLPLLAPYLVNVRLGKFSGVKKFCIQHPRFLPLLRNVLRFYNVLKGILRQKAK